MVLVCQFFLFSNQNKYFKKDKNLFLDLSWALFVEKWLKKEILKLNKIKLSLPEAMLPISLQTGLIRGSCESWLNSESMQPAFRSKIFKS